MIFDAWNGSVNIIEKGAGKELRCAQRRKMRLVINALASQAPLLDEINMKHVQTGGMKTKN